VVITKSTVDNLSGAFSIRMELAQLDKLIVQLNYNIEKFNMQVKNLLSDLARRGDTSTDIIFNLIRAYRCVPVKEFTNFIDRMKDEMDDRTEVIPSPQYLMDKSENKFKALVKEKIWDHGINNNDELMALRAEVDRMKKGKKYGLGHGQQRSQSRRKRATRTRVEVDITKKPDDVNKPVIHNGKQWWWCSDETG